MKKLILTLFLPLIVFSQECTIESLHYLVNRKISTLKVLTLENNQLKMIKSSQGVEGKFYYEQKNKQLQYIELSIYGEMGKTIVKFYFDGTHNVLTQMVREYYNHHIYDNTSDIKVLSRKIDEFPLCLPYTKENKTLFLGISEKEYNDMIELVQKLNKVFRTYIGG